jgi:HEAT repeat protein
MSASGEVGRCRRRRDVTIAGHRGDATMARGGLADEDPHVRAAALVALARLGVLSPDDLGRGLHDEDAVVRRRACEVAAAHPDIPADIATVLADGDGGVAEVAAWAAGERGDASAVAALATMATAHDDPLCREAAVAALGAIGDPAGLPAILAATRDRPAVRRRAVIALAPFEGPEVDEALARARSDRDWQVRQAADELA